MAVNKRARAIRALNKYIWTLKHQCGSITKVNAELIMQYCRFTVLAEEISIDIAANAETMNAAALKNKIAMYERFNKIALNLYKVLKFGEIRDELADYGNPYTKLLNEAQEDGDF